MSSFLRLCLSLSHLALIQLLDNHEAKTSHSLSTLTKMDLANEKARLCLAAASEKESQRDILDSPLLLSYDSPISLYRPYEIFFQNLFCSSLNVTVWYPFQTLSLAAYSSSLHEIVSSLVQSNSCGSSFPSSQKQLSIIDAPGHNQQKYSHPHPPVKFPSLEHLVDSDNHPAAAANSSSSSPPLHLHLRRESRRVIISQSSQRKANAVLLVLCRNQDLHGIVSSLIEFESRFNDQYHYPYLFLNQDPFSDHFKKIITQLLSSSFVEFGLISPEEWSLPSWINSSQVGEVCLQMKASQIPHGGSVSYRHMCRYFSGFFFRHPLILKYDYFWRIEPSVSFTCTISYDPFLFLMDHNKSYGFTIMLPEYPETIPSLWNHTLHYLLTYYSPSTRSFDLTRSPFPSHSASLSFSPSPPHDFSNSLPFLKEYFSDTLLGEVFLNPFSGQFNLCHFWSNFEISSLSFFRSEEYLHFFSYLDSLGGIYYERWGDALIHSLALGIFMKKEEVHYFEDIGYRHEPFENCPNHPVMQREYCDCDAKKSVNWNNYCHAQYMRLSYPVTW
jgi:alpha 1,2-mannosyltransferase